MAPKTQSLVTRINALVSIEALKTMITPEIASEIAQYAETPMVSCQDCHKEYTITNPARWQIGIPSDCNVFFDASQNVYVQETVIGTSLQYQLICKPCSILRVCTDCNRIAFPSVIDEFMLCTACHALCHKCSQKYDRWMDLLDLNWQTVLPHYCKRCNFENQWRFQRVPISVPFLTWMLNCWEG